LEEWQRVSGLPYVIVTSNTEPRILVRAGTDGLGTSSGRGGLDGTYSNGRARSGLVVIRPDLAQCTEASRVGCLILFLHELGHAIGFFEHVDGAGIMGSGRRPSVREVNLLMQLYRLPHGAAIQADGHWRVVR
jgi:predicted Zn-dependent protease